MDVNLTTQVPLPQGQQQQSAPNATNQSGATATVQNVPDNVVTAATDATETSAREDDALRRQDRSEREQALASLQDFQLQGLRTRVGFDAESDRVFLEILLPRTEEVIRRIPSENLIEFLQSEVDPVAARSSSAQALDASI
ncbi:MAG: flagellar protein FlaG [Alphaproteobacteria bacterium]